MKRIILAAALAASASTPAVALPFINGSFETAPSYSAQTPPGAVPSWTVIGDGVEWFQSATYDSGGGNWGPAHDGLSIIDLAYDNGAAGAFGGIQQTFDTVANQVYSLSFWGINRISNGRDGDGVANILINGNSIGSQNIVRYAGNWSSPSDWTQYFFSFTANNTGSTTLAFTNSEDANTNFALIDDVAVTAVPEPTVWALMLLGFALIGGVLRSRTRRTGLMQLA